MSIKKREIAFWLAVGTAIVLTFKAYDAHGAPSIQVCQSGRCEAEADPEILQCVAKSCELMAEGVYLCQAEVCVNRPDPDAFRPRLAFNLNLAVTHYAPPGADSPVREHNEDPDGFGIEYHIAEDLFFAVNRFDNSYGEDSVSLTAGSYFIRGRFAQIGAEAGVASGYQIAGNSLKAPKVDEDKIFVAGIIIRVGNGFAIKTLVTPDFVGVQAQYVTGGGIQ